jgi:hypothetical protein
VVRVSRASPCRSGVAAGRVQETITAKRARGTDSDSQSENSGETRTPRQSGRLATIRTLLVSPTRKTGGPSYPARSISLLCLSAKAKPSPPGLPSCQPGDTTVHLGQSALTPVPARTADLRRCRSLAFRYAGCSSHERPAAGSTAPRGRRPTRGWSAMTTAGAPTSRISPAKTSC